MSMDSILGSAPPASGHCMRRLPLQQRSQLSAWNACDTARQRQQLRRDSCRFEGIVCDRAFRKGRFRSCGGDAAAHGAAPACIGGGVAPQVQHSAVPRLSFAAGAPACRRHATATRVKAGARSYSSLSPQRFPWQELQEGKTFFGAGMPEAPAGLAQQHRLCKQCRACSFSHNMYPVPKSESLNRSAPRPTQG